MTTPPRDRSRRARSYGTRRAGTGAGAAADATDGPVIDPTENVIALNRASIERVDDLQHLYRLLSESELARIEQIALLRAEHSKEIRQLESDRLDKIRQVDVLAGNTAADRALIAIQTLAATTTANAETLRSMVANTAQTIATQTSNTVAQQNERISALEKSSYTGMGKQSYADPQIVDAIAKLEAMRVAMAAGEGKSAGMSASWTVLLGVVALASALLGIGGVLFGMLSRH